MSKVRKGKKEEGGVLVFFALCFTSLLAYGLWALFDLPENKSFEH